MRACRRRLAAGVSSKLLESAALDPYAFRRDAYLQKRLNDIYDGNTAQDDVRYDLDEPQTPADTKP